MDPEAEHPVETLRRGAPARWRALAPWLAPGALVVIALHQIALAQLADLSPWKGGGYGMFSTTDHGGARFLRVYALDAGGERRVPLPPELVNRSYRVRDLPSPRGLRRLAREIAAAAPESVAGSASLRLEVWRTVHDPITLEPRRAVLREAVVPPPPPPPLP